MSVSHPCASRQGSNISALTIACALFVALAGMSSEAGAGQRGLASWYSLTSLTASGERCNPKILAAAHRTLPFDTVVRVESVSTGQDVIVRINDRGPFVDGRVIDLTKGAAERLGIVEKGIDDVRITVLRPAT